MCTFKSFHFAGIIAKKPNKKHRPNSQSCGLQGENTANTDEGPYNSK